MTRDFEWTLAPFANIFATLAALAGIASCKSVYLDPVAPETSGDAGTATTPGANGAGSGLTMLPAADKATPVDPGPPRVIASDGFPAFCTSNNWCGANVTLSAIWGPASDDVWALVRDIGDTTTAGAVLHYDGVAWSILLGDLAQYYGVEQLDPRAVWGTAANDVWVAGSLGILLHWDGSSWIEFAAGGAYALKGIWGSGRDDFWAVGDAGTILRWDGHGWNHVSGPYEAPDRSLTRANLTGVWGSAGNDVWIVGGAGVVLHWDGNRWSKYEDAFHATPTTADLTAIWGSAGDDVWATGTAGVVLHWDGSSWSVSDRVPTRNDLYAVWGTGRDNVWAAGAGGTLIHRTETAWYVAPPTTAETLLSVWTSSDGQIWAVGARGAAVHWKASGWAATATRPFTKDLYSVRALAPNNVWVAGAGGTIARWNGSTWVENSLPVTSDVKAISPAIRDGVAMVGDGGTVLLCHMFGAAPNCGPFGPSQIAVDLRAVWSFADGAQIWVGGGGGQIWSYDDQRGWTQTSTPTTADVTSMWGANQSDLWAATEANDMLHWNGSAWSRSAVSVIPYNQLTHWRQLSGTASNDVWAVGAGEFGQSGIRALAMHWDGRAWSDASGNTTGKERLPNLSNLGNSPFRMGVWAAAPGEAWLVAEGAFYASQDAVRTMLHRTGGAWQRGLSGTPTDLYAVSGSSVNDIWSVGAGGTVLRRHLGSN